MSKTRKLSKKIIALIVVGCILGCIAITALGMWIAFKEADKIECWSPDYDMIDISGLLNKSELSDEDYEVLYRQTGLTKIGIDRCLGRGVAGKNRILAVQRDYFGEYVVVNDLFAPYICTDFITDKNGTEVYITSSYLENGDILVTSSTHLSGWRFGHAGLVTKGSTNEVLQASAYGSTSALETVYDFTSRVNFMIFSPDFEQSLKDEVAEFARENLIGMNYDVTAGVLSNKNKVQRTQCAHIVWYAYNQFGIDLDSDGGLVVTPRNLALSPYLRLVQVFGFDPDKLWS